jgi:hypothetical protein
VTLPPRIVLTGSTGALEVVGERIVLREGQRAIDMFVPDSDTYDPFRPAACVRRRRPRRAVRHGDLDGIPTFTDGLACVAVMDRLFAAKA